MGRFDNRSVTTGRSSVPSKGGNQSQSSKNGQPWQQADALMAPTPTDPAASSSATISRLRSTAAGLGPAADIETLQRICDAFRWGYNYEWPCRSLDQRIPAIVCSISRKASCADTCSVRLAGRVLKVSSAELVNFRKRCIDTG